MTEFFLSVVNISISAGWIILAIVPIRLLLKKAPKWITALLWGIVALRLVFPFSIESALSLIPSAQTIPPQVSLGSPQIHSGVGVIDNTINPIIGNTTISLGPDKNVNLFQWILPYLAAIWIVGIVVLLIYTTVSTLRLQSKIKTAILLHDNIYQSEHIAYPFVLGIINPKIFLPFHMTETAIGHVVAHETAHIRRKDHLWKPLGFLLLTLHWFNPLIWLGYFLLSRDIELACDEEVIKTLGHDARADYSETLLSCSVNRRMVVACPLAFGEVGVKRRVRSVLHYKKPAFWMIAMAILTLIATVLCFLTNPPSDTETNAPNERSDIFTDYNGIYVTLKSTENDADGHTVFNLIWHNDTKEEVTYGEFYSIMRKSGDGWENTERKDHVFLTIGYRLAPGATESKKYSTENFDVSVSGKYRLTVPFSVKKGAHYEDYTTWIEFEVNEAPSQSGLKEKYPQFYGLDASDGLTVYVWQISPSHYSCHLVSSTTDRWSDQSFAFGVGASIGEMRMILSNYTLPKDKINLVPVHNPISSYYYEINDEYQKRLEAKFWSEMIPSVYEYENVYDTASFDIDSDGINEMCSMTRGHTSGLFTFAFNVHEIGKEEVKYHTLFYSQVYDLSFLQCDDGTTKVKAVTRDSAPSTHLFDIAISNGNVSLTENGIPIGEVVN